MFSASISPPLSEAELVQRATALAGMSLGDIAKLHGVKTPNNLLHHKGWVGQLLEKVLGADAGNAARPDFTGLNVELKTIPVNAYGRPQESTYVTIVPLLGSPGLNWQNSDVRAKLAHVLWLPIEVNSRKSLASRRVGRAILWHMPAHIEAIIKADWQELMEYVLLGDLDQIDARYGHYLHIRPKAANSKVLTTGLSLDGDKIHTLPRGFYLRSQLTEQIITKKC